MTVGQFLFSLTIPRLTRRFGDGVTLTVGLAFVLVGLLWLTRLTPDTSYLTGFIPALLLIGVGQGLAFGPITAAGIAGARPEDAGAASGVINTAHQLGSTLGIAILTTAAAGAATLADQVVIAYTGGTIMIGLALVVTVSLILPADLTNRRAHPVTHVGR
jgi:sugar phosphate permease